MVHCCRPVESFFAGVEACRQLHRSRPKSRWFLFLFPREGAYNLAPKCASVANNEKKYAPGRPQQSGIVCALGNRSTSSRYFHLTRLAGANHSTRSNNRAMFFWYRRRSMQKKHHFFSQRGGSSLLARAFRKCLMWLREGAPSSARGCGPEYYFIRRYWPFLFG